MSAIDRISVEHRLPDSETTVLIFQPESDDPVWMGWYDDERGWHDVDATPLGVGLVTHWSPIPMGPVPPTPGR